MSARELIVLGTASQVPTRTRAQHGALLKWDDEAILFDPGEGTQRQLLLAGVSPSTITRICITHAHGDHCLGLPGVLLRLALDGVRRPIELYYPVSAREFIDRLYRATASSRIAEVREHPVSSDGVVATGEGWELQTRALEHRIETYGWRLQEHDGRRMLPTELHARGVTGPDIGRLRRHGGLDVDGRWVGLDEVSAIRRGQSFAFIMDTRLCPAAVELARGADLVVCESTFLSTEAELAAAYEHLTAAQAAQLASDAGARRLVLTHFSQRYTDEKAFAAEARAVFPETHVARDLDRIPMPRRIGQRETP